MQLCVLSTMKHLVGELGFEPRLTESESAVLPLNDSPIPPFSSWEIYPFHFSYKNKKGAVCPFYKKLIILYQLSRIALES